MTKKNHSMWMPCISREETPETFELLLFWELHWMRKILEEGGMGSQMCLLGSPEGMKSPRGVLSWGSRSTSLQAHQLDMLSKSSSPLLACTHSCSEFLLPTYPRCLLRDDKSIRPHEQSFTRRSSCTSREHHQSCACSELRAAEWTRPLLYPSPSV